VTGITPPPPQPTPPAQPAQPAPDGDAQPTPATPEHLPERLRDVARPVVVQGTVVDSQKTAALETLVRIRTQMGEVTVRSPAPVPPGPVTVQVPAGNPPATVLLLPQGQPPAAQAPVPQAPVPQVPTTQPPAATTPLPLPTLPKLVVGMTVPAQVFPAPPQPTQPLPVPGLPMPAVPAPGVAGHPGAGQAPMGQTGLGHQLPAGQAPGGQAAMGQAPTGQAPVTGFPAGPPAFAGPPTGSVLPGAPTAPGVPPSPTSQAQTAPPGPAASPTGGAAPPAQFPQPLPGVPALPVSTGQVRIVEVTPPDQAPQEAPGRHDPGMGAADATGRRLTAVVSGTTSGGQPILTAGRTLLVLQAVADLPPGTRVRLEGAAPAPTMAPAAFDPVAGTEWPALKQALSTLQNADPQAARTFSNALLAHPNGRMAAGIALFMGIARSGIDPRAWLGERAAQALEQVGRGDLLDRLGEDVRSMQRQAEAAVEWRSFPVPIANNGELEQATIRVKRKDDDDDEDGGRKRKGGGTRFLVDVTLSRLGPLQLDGFVRPSARRLDMMLRTRDPLPGRMRTELTDIYDEALAEIRYLGQLSFRSGADSGWIPLGPDAARTHRGVIA